MHPDFSDPTGLLRELKGAPLSILFFLLLGHQPATQKQICEILGYSDKTVSKALRFLQRQSLVTRTASGWTLAGGPLLAGLFSQEASETGSRKFSDSEQASRKNSGHENAHHSSEQDESRNFSGSEPGLSRKNSDSNSSESRNFSGFGPDEGRNFSGWIPEESRNFSDSQAGIRKISELEPLENRKNSDFSGESRNFSDALISSSRDSYPINSLCESLLLLTKGRKISDREWDNLAAMREVGISRNHRTMALAGLEHVAPAYIHGHVAQALSEEKGTIGLAIHRMFQGEPAPEVNRRGLLLDCQCEKCQLAWYSESMEKYLS